MCYAAAFVVWWARLVHLPLPLGVLQRYRLTSRWILHFSNLDNLYELYLSLFYSTKCPKSWTSSTLSTQLLPSTISERSTNTLLSICFGLWGKPRSILFTEDRKLDWLSTNSSSLQSNEMLSWGYLLTRWGLTLISSLKRLLYASPTVLTKQ